MRLVFCSGRRARNSHPREPVRILLGLCNHGSNLGCFKKLQFKPLGTRWWEIVRLSTLMSRVELCIQTQKVFWLVLVESLCHVRLCNPMYCSTPGFPVFYCLPEFAQTHVHWVSDAIQPSHPLLPPSPLAVSLSQHQSLPMSWPFVLGGQSIRASASASVLPMNNIQDWLPVGLIDWISLQSKGLSGVFSSARVLKHQFFST